jgi:oligopeptidase B
MKPQSLFTQSILIIFAIFSTSGCNKKNIVMNPPMAEKIKKELSVNGHTRIDYYYWLNDRNNPKVLKYLEAENAYTEAVMKDYSKLRDKLFNEIVGRIKQDDSSVPYIENGYYYYTRYEKGKEYPVYCRKKSSLEAPEEILLNVNEMAKGYSYFQLSNYSISKNNEYISYGVDTLSRRLYTVYFKDLKTGKIIDVSIPNASGAVAWANDNKVVFYAVKNTKTLRSCKIFRHYLGQPLSKDKLVYEEKDETYRTFVYKTKSSQFIMIASLANSSSEYRFLNADNPSGFFTVIQPREKDIEYSVDHFKDKFYIVTNYQAKNFRLVETPVVKPNKENWKDMIAHRPDVLLDDIDIFSKYLVVIERKNGLIQMRIINWKTHEDHYLNFGEEVYTASIGPNPDFDSDFLRFNYSSLTTPNSVYDYYFSKRRKVLRKQQEVLGGFERRNYEAKRLYATSPDGQKVPISLVYRKGIKLDGNNPLLLYGYGSYGISNDPYFSSVRLSLLDRGFICAIAHVRGGQEMGRDWYENGKKLNKINTFNDFIDCAEYLISQKYTNPSKFFAYGGSAGGLLIGSVANMRPDLFKGLIAAVPFVDVLTTMLDKNIPLTTGEYDEWGNPNDSLFYNYILSYSPYDNVKKMNYPAMLVTTGLYDSQVQYWEPAKWVAKLRSLKTDSNLLLLYTNLSAGHGGASGRFETHKETALQYAFLLKLLKINN